MFPKPDSASSKPLRETWLILKVKYGRFLFRAGDCALYAIDRVLLRPSIKTLSAQPFLVPKILKKQNVV